MADLSDNRRISGLHRLKIGTNAATDGVSIALHDPSRVATSNRGHPTASLGKRNSLQRQSPMRLRESSAEKFVEASILDLHLRFIWEFRDRKIC